MIAKVIEVRDRNTFIPALAIKMVPDNPAQRYLLGRVGFYEGTQIVLMRLNDQEAHSDPYDWTPASFRTMPQAHLWLLEHFDEVEEGGVVDVEFILGETSAPKQSDVVEEAAWLAKRGEG